MIKILLFLTTIIIFSANLVMAEESTTAALHPKNIKWKAEGFFGKFDKASIQRGYKIYKEVCSSCHSLKLLSYRNLSEVGFTENEVKQIASEYNVTDGPGEDGEMFMRPALPSDKFVSLYANEQASRAANNGAYPPDLSLIIKARQNGSNYVYSILTGFTNTPNDFEIVEGKFYNPYFEGRQISMPPPFTDDGTVEYNVVPTKEQMAIDIVNFLQFAAEPEMEARKKMGIRTMIFLVILIIIFIIAKKLIWKKVK